MGKAFSNVVGGSTAMWVMKVIENRTLIRLMMA
jgi:hypothetical protein